MWSHPLQHLNVCVKTNLVWEQPQITLKVLLPRIIIPNVSLINSRVGYVLEDLLTLLACQYIVKSGEWGTVVQHWRGRGLQFRVICIISFPSLLSHVRWGSWEPLKPCAAHCLVLGCCQRHFVQLRQTTQREASQPPPAAAAGTSDCYRGHPALWPMHYVCVVRGLSDLWSTMW